MESEMTISGGVFPKYFIGGAGNEGYRIFGSTLGSSCFGKLSCVRCRRYQNYYDMLRMEEILH